MSMNSDFSEWFRAAGMEPQADELQKRWAGVDAFEAGRDEVVSLVELFFGFCGGKDTFLASFRKAFQDADASFRMRDNDRELAVLAVPKACDTRCSLLAKPRRAVRKNRSAACSPALACRAGAPACGRS